MVLLLPLLMAYSLVGETAHEYLGIGMSLLFVAHHILNVAWWKHLLRGKYTPLRILGTAIDLALVVIMLALPISGMILSRYVFRFLHLGGAATARTVHLLASYWGLVLMSFHAGMHGNRIMEVFRKITTTQQTSKIRTWSLRMIIVLLAICGLYTYIKNKIGLYLFLRTQFVFVDFSQPVVWSLIDYLLVSILFIVLGYVCTYLICLKHIHKYNHWQLSVAQTVEKIALLLMLFFYKSIIQVQRHNDCRSIDKNIYNSLNENTTEISWYKTKCHFSFAPSFPVW